VGYDLRLLTAGVDQLQYLQQHPEHTADFLGGRRPVREEREVVRGWFKTTERVYMVPVDLSCTWPDSEPMVVDLVSRAGLYYMLNGTDEACVSVTNFPNVGGRYRGEMLGEAIELGHTGFGHAHAFMPGSVAKLHAALSSIDEPTLTARARHIATAMEWDDALDDVPNDMKKLRAVVDEAVQSEQGLVWYWG